mmetsp:Transcript_76972/g.215938  ORF Transcript_76972/g.215938 Transcript_76972/m.215938 type:complete len:214 (-) Transcript_76972:569-1210(-)
MLRRERRLVRGLPRPRGRRHLRRVEPRIDHRRHPPLQGAAVPIRPHGHGALGGHLEGVRRQGHAPPHDRHGRRLLHGRGHCAPQGDLRSCRAVRRAGLRRRVPRHRLPREDGPRHAPVVRRRGAGGRHQQHIGQGARGRHRRLHHRPQGAHRLAPEQGPAILVLEHLGALRRRRVHRGLPNVERELRLGREVAVQCPAVPHRDGVRGLQAQRA